MFQHIAPASQIFRRRLAGLIGLAGIAVATGAFRTPVASPVQPQSSTRQDPDKLADRARRAGEVLAELMRVSDSAPPTSLLRQATCVAAVPGVVQVGLGVGGRVGQAGTRSPISGHPSPQGKDPQRGKIPPGQSPVE